MNKQQLIDEIALRSDLNKSQAARALGSIIDIVGDTLAKGDNVALVGFGTFAVKERAARTGRNPQTGEPLTIEAAIKPTFKPGKDLIARVSQE